MPLERLQKIIAAAGVASRRKAEELIQQGLVSVNGKTVTELGSKADLETDSIRVNDKLLKGAERHEYIALNKPRGYVTTVSDPEGRATVMELVKSKVRLYPVGRLDFNSEGLLLLTNDGDLAHKLMKAASHIPKTYLVKVAGQPEEEQLRRFRAGVSIAEERNPGRRVRTAPALIRVIKEAENPWLEVTLHEGRNRQIRKMFEEIGHHVEKIRRVRYGPLELDLPPGESRMLSSREVAQLQRATQPQSEFARPHGGSQFRTKSEAGQRRLERAPREHRSEVRRDGKEGKSFVQTDRRERDGRDRDFEPNRDKRQRSGNSREAGVSGRKMRTKQFSRPGSAERPQGEARRPKFGGESSSARRNSRSSRFAGRPSKNNRGKERNQSRNRGPNRFGGR